MTDVEVFEAPQPATITPTGLALADGLDVDQWADAGRPIVRTHASSMWWIGDWMLYAERHFADDPTVAKRLARVIEGSGVEPQTLKVARWVAASIETDRRRERLSWSHHREVAALTGDVADDLLDQAQELGLSRRELKDLVTRVTALDVGAEEKSVEPSGYPCVAVPSGRCDSLAIEDAPAPLCEEHAAAFVEWWEKQRASYEALEPKFVGDRRST